MTTQTNTADSNKENSQKVLFICTGNICRSPMAEGILRDRIQRDNLAMRVDSAGTHGYHVGELYDSRARQTLKNHGIDVADLRSRHLIEADFEQFDTLFIADNINYQVIAERWGQENADKTLLMTAFSNKYQGQAVADPYYGDADDFENVYNMLVDSIDGFLQTRQHKVTE